VYLLISEVVVINFIKICKYRTYGDHSNWIPKYGQRLLYVGMLGKRGLFREKTYFYGIFTIQNAESVGRFI